MKIINIEVEGMNCGRCVSKITNHFQTIDSIEKTEVFLEGQRVVITGEDDLSNMKIRNDIIELGFSIKSIKTA